MLGTSGNLSILVQDEPLNFLITASGKDKGELTEDDFLLVDELGVIARSEATKQSHKSHSERSEESHNVIRSFVANAPQDDITMFKPSAETLLHSAIYKNTKAKAVYHVHTTNSTLLSKSSAIEFSGLEMLKGLGFKTHDVKVIIPVIENSQDMKYLSSIVPSYINEDVPGFVLRGHGLYAWGKTPHEAKRHVEIFEFLFEYRVKEL